MQVLEYHFILFPTDCNPTKLVLLLIASVAEDELHYVLVPLTLPGFRASY